MYVGNRHTATVTVKDVLPFTCKLCGHSADALVVGVGQGQGNSAYFLDENGAKSRASSSAEESARKNLTQTLALARCPKCQGRDEGAVNALRIKAIVGGLLTVVAFLGMGFLLDALNHGSAGLYIFGPLGIFTGGFIYWAQKWKWETAEGRVVFPSTAAE